MTHPEYLRIPFTVRELYEQLVPYRHNRRELAIETNDDYEAAVARLLSGERGYVDSDPAMQEALRRELASPTGDPGAFKDYGDTTLTLAPVTEAIQTPVPGIAQPAHATPAPAHAPALDTASSNGAANVAAPAAPAPSTPPTQPAATQPAPTQAAPSAAPTTRPAAASAPSELPIERASARVTAAYDAISPAASTAPQAAVPSILSSLSQNDVPTGCRFCGGTLPEGREANFCPHCGENLRTKRCPACGTEMDASWKFCVSCGRRAT
jgi:hypothetical protein